MVVAVAAFAGTPVQASSSYSTRAIEEGIGYRSNLLDPANPYASGSRYLLETLLRRYSLFPADDKRDRRPTNKMYLEGMKRLLSSPRIMSKITAPLDSYHYAYGICETNDYPAALEYMEQVVAEFGRSGEADRLVLARHNLLGSCQGN